MKKLLMLCCALCLLAVPAGVAQVCAGTYGTDITIPDNASNPPTYPTTEVLETEPGTQTGHRWDLTAFQFDRSTQTLSIIGGFDFKNGVDGQTIGDLFFKGDTFADQGNPPTYGVNNYPVDGNSEVSNTLTWGNPPNQYTWGYDFAIRFTIGENNTYSYNIFSATDEATVILHGPSGVSGSTNVGYVSNPWKMGNGWEQLNDLALTGEYLTLQTVNGDNGNPYSTSTYNVIKDLDIIFLGGPGAAFWAHLTYDCGNDNLMGYDINPPGNVPIPGSVLLLGSGLVGLSLLGFRRRKRDV